MKSYTLIPGWYKRAKKKYVGKRVSSWHLSPLWFAGGVSLNCNDHMIIRKSQIKSLNETMNVLYDMDRVEAFWFARGLKVQTNKFGFYYKKKEA